MRAFFLDTHPSAPKRRALLFAALLLAALCALALTEASAPAKTPQEKLEATQGKLDDVRADQSSLAETIAEQNARDRLDDRRSLGAAPEAGRGRGRTGRKAGRAGSGDGGAEEGKGAPGRGPRPARPRPRRAARAPGRDLRGGLARTSINAILESDELVGDGGPDRIPEPDPELRRLGRRAGSRRCATKSPAPSPSWPTTAPRSRTRATRSPRSSAKSPPPAPRPRRASPN